MIIATICTIKHPLLKYTYFCSSRWWSELDVDMCASFSLRLHLTVTCDLGASRAKLARAINARSVLLFLWWQTVPQAASSWCKNSCQYVSCSVLCTRPTSRHDLACWDIWYSAVVDCPCWMERRLAGQHHTKTSRGVDNLFLVHELNETLCWQTYNICNEVMT